MKCPNCNVTLLMTTRQDVEIDYCPECRGIWLDRGELEKIISRTRAAEQEMEQSQARPTRTKRFDDSSSDMHMRGRSDEGGYYDPYTDKRKRKSSRLSDLFDLF